MSQPSTAREALLAELLGDVHRLIERVESADKSARATAEALTEATTQYRGQVDEMTARLRAETASIITQTTDHAAKALVGQQAATLQKAAAIAMEKTLSAQLIKRTRRDWLSAAAVGAAVGALVSLVVVLAVLKGLL